MVHDAPDDRGEGARGIATIRALKAFRAAYREARERFGAGEHGVEFPEGVVDLSLCRPGGGRAALNAGRPVTDHDRANSRAQTGA